MMTVRALAEALNTLFKALSDVTINSDMYDQMKKTAELVVSLASTLKKYRSVNPEFIQAK